MSPSTSTTIETGLGGLPKINLATSNGAQAEVYLHGAHLTSWTPAGDQERLFLSRTSEFHPNAAIRGGVPIIFPQFGSLGPLQKHGFARVQPWDLISISGDGETAAVKLCLHDAERTHLLWPHTFQAEMRISIRGNRLELNLSVLNNGDKPFTFTAALHTYLRVEEILTTVVGGLYGNRYHDTVNRPTPSDWIENAQIDPEVHFTGEVDRVYYNVSRPIIVREPGRVTQIMAVGFPDAVLWNPGPVKGARLVDLEPDGYRRFVCVEAALAGTPVTLQSGDTWQAAQVLVA